MQVTQVSKYDYKLIMEISLKLPTIKHQMSKITKL